MYSLLPPPDQPDAVNAILYFTDIEGVGGATGVGGVERHGGPSGESWRVAKEWEESDGSWPAGEVLLPPMSAAKAELGRRDFTPHRNREQRPDIYRGESAVRYRVGSCLLFRSDCWHRGTPVSPGAARWSMKLGVRRSDATWVQFQAFAKDLFNPQMSRFIAGLDSGQLSVLGFPPPKHPYWDRRTVAATADRYHGLDMRDYLARL